MVIVDEIHEYRGYFGTNCPLLLKRFLLKLSRMGSRPQLFLSTATCANPEEHANRLTGRSFTLINSHCHMRPERHFYFINPLSLPNYKFKHFYQSRVARAVLACLSYDLSIIIFCPSRKFAEEISKLAKNDAKKRHLDQSVIMSYRAGYHPDDRRNIEKGLRDGKYKAVFSTNALEIGIDIGRLDVCVLAGFPENVMSAWQRIGRASRSFDKTAYVIYYAMNNVVDRFYAGNIDSFLNKPLDVIAIGLDNEELIKNHLPYILHESNWDLSPEDREIIGDAFFYYAQNEIETKQPLSSGNGPYYGRLSIRGISGQNYKLKHNNKEIGTMSEVQRFREAYLGAYYTHCGITYRVKSHGLNNVIELEDADPSLKTEPTFFTNIQESEIFEGSRFAKCISTFYGKLTIYENFFGYKLVKDPDEILEEYKADDALRNYVYAFWITFENNNLIRSGLFEKGIRAFEQMLRIGTIFAIPSDRHDISTHSRNNPSFSVYIYENVPGGIGIAEKALSNWAAILRQGRHIAKECPCEKGCPTCIFPSYLRDSEIINKQAGIELAEEILSHAETPTEQYDPHIHAWSQIEKDAAV